MAGHQKFGQLCLDPLFAHTGQAGSQSPESLSRIRLDLKAQLGTEPEGPQHPQGIFPKTIRRLSHAADQPLLQVADAAKQVHKTCLSAVGHGIDGEIPAFQILFQTGGKYHIFRVPAVLILAVDAVGSDLVGLFSPHDRDRAVGNPRIDGPGKQRLYLPGQGRGGDIPVPRRLSQKAVPDASAYDTCLKTAAMQCLQNILCLFGHPDMEISLCLFSGACDMIFF